MTLTIDKQVRRWVRRAVRRVYPPTYILGRVACLGQDVFNAMPAPLRPRYHALLNMQKVRCDIINEWAAGDGKIARTKAGHVMPHLARTDVAWLIEQQQRMIWFEHAAPVTCAVMDTFAELTDQRFRHRREGWSFCSHYTDLHHTPEFQAEFECEGLLPLEAIGPTYQTFTQWFAERYPGILLYIIDFAAAHDERLQFKQRAAAIRDALVTLSRTNPQLHFLSLPEDQIEKAPGDDFAYHFSKTTVDRIAAVWREKITRGGSHGEN